VLAFERRLEEELVQSVVPVFAEVCVSFRSRCPLGMDTALGPPCFEHFRQDFFGRGSVRVVVAGVGRRSGERSDERRSVRRGVRLNSRLERLPRKLIDDCRLEACFQRKDLLSSRTLVEIVVGSCGLCHQDFRILLRSRFFPLDGRAASWALFALA